MPRHFKTINQLSLSVVMMRRLSLKNMKKVIHIVSAILFTGSFLCMLAFYGETLRDQVLWTLSWIPICGITGIIFYTLDHKTNKHNGK